MKLQEILRGVIPERYWPLVSGRYEEIGDICLLKLPIELSDFYSEIGQAVLERYSHFRVVAVRTGHIVNQERVGEIRVISGENRTETIHKEYGCRYKLDLSKVFFTPRLSYEHNRVAKLVRNGETVLNMFSGIGAFSILIAKRVKNCKVYSVDINPYAIKYLEENIRLNKVEDKIIPILGDAAEIKEPKFADRIIMPLPLKAYNYLEIAARKISPGGIIHYYDTLLARGTKTQQLDKLSEKVTTRLEELSLKVEIRYRRRIRSLNPGFYLSVLDIQASKK